MDHSFSERTKNVKASEVRELLKFAEDPEIIAFGGGLPAPETFPVNEMMSICQEILANKGMISMQYGRTEGYLELRKLIQKKMNKKGVEATTENIIITSGSQQGLDLTAKLFIDEGDYIICEKPTYLAAINAFKFFAPRFIDVKMDQNGIMMDELEKKLKIYKRIKFIYTIPDYQNPTGISMSLDRRKRLIEIANEYKLIIIEDDPYSELGLENNILPPIKSFDNEGRVVYLSTFSKTVCPGFRIGWICADKEIINKYILFKQGTDIHTNMFSQLQIAEYIKKFDMQEHTKKLRCIYKKKRDVMIEAIKNEFPSSIEYTNPKGGMFVWVTLPKKIDSRKLLVKALKNKVAFVPGEAFFPNGGNKNTVRLNYSGINEEKIAIGIKRLAEVIKEEI